MESNVRCRKRVVMMGAAEWMIGTGCRGPRVRRRFGTPQREKNIFKLQGGDCGNDEECRGRGKKIDVMDRKV